MFPAMIRIVSLAGQVPSWQMKRGCILNCSKRKNNTKHLLLYQISFFEITGTLKNCLFGRTSSLLAKIPGTACHWCSGQWDHPPYLEEVAAIFLDALASPRSKLRPSNQTQIAKKTSESITDIKTGLCSSVNVNASNVKCKM